MFRALQRFLIAALGGHDTVTVNNLMYRANTLLSCTENIIKHKKLSKGLQSITESQIKGVKLATIKLDPYYAFVKGYKFIPGERALRQMAEGARQRGPTERAD